MPVLTFSSMSQSTKDSYGNLFLTSASVLIAAIALYLCAVQLLQPSPQNAWDSALHTEAWRIAKGLPLTHAGIAYGPLSVGIIAEVFKLTGPSMCVGRIISLIAAILTISIVTRLVSGGLIGWCLLFGISLRTANYFVEPRPDMVALLFAVIAVICFYKNGRLFYAGLAALVVSMLFKQTGAAVALVPAATFFLGERPKVSRVVLPLVTVAMVLMLWRLSAPQSFQYAVTNFKQYPIPPRVIIANTLDLIGTIPLFWVCFVQRLDGEWDRLTKWLLAIALLTAATGIVSESKAGGTYNSLLPCLFVLFAFCGRELRQVRWPLTGLAAILAVGSLAAHAGSAVKSAYTPLGNSNYGRVVMAVRSLPGLVTCPDDPFLVVLAKGDPRLSIYLENDAIGWPGGVPKAALQEIEASDYVVQIPGSIITNDVLTARKFQPLEDLGGYIIWRRSQ